MNVVMINVVMINDVGVEVVIDGDRSEYGGFETSSRPRN